MRELKTTPVNVILFAASKTKNILTTRAKEKDDYDRAEDLYRYMYEQVPTEFTPDLGTLDRIDEIRAGRGPDSEEGSDFTADGKSTRSCSSQSYCQPADRSCISQHTRLSSSP